MAFYKYYLVKNRKENFFISGRMKVYLAPNERSHCTKLFKLVPIIAQTDIGFKSYLKRRSFFKFLFN